MPEASNSALGTAVADGMANAAGVDITPILIMSGIAAIGAFELISGFIAFLAILIALSDRIIKNYDDVRRHLNRIYINSS